MVELHPDVGFYMAVETFTMAKLLLVIETAICDGKQMTAGSKKFKILKNFWYKRK